MDKAFGEIPSKPAIYWRGNPADEPLTVRGELTSAARLRSLLSESHAVPKLFSLDLPVQMEALPLRVFR